MKHTSHHLLMLVILNKTDYIENLGNIVRESIGTGSYTLTENNTIKDFKNFKQLFKQNLKGYNKFHDILPTSN